MKISEFSRQRPQPNNNIVVQEDAKVTTERKVNEEAQASDSTSHSSLFSKKNFKYIIPISIVAVLLVAGVIVLIVYLTGGNGNDDNNSGNGNPNSSIIVEPPSKPPIDIEKAKEVFSSSYKVSSKEDTLIQLSQKSSQNYESTTNGKKSSYIIFSKSIIDIYTINSTEPSEEEKDFFNKKYMTVITMNSLCSKVSSDIETDDCQLEKNLDLNKREESNLRRNDENENDEELIRKAILPICIIEHTDTNLIISITCPETLSSSYKEDLIRAFSNVKPNTIKGFEFNKEYINTIKEEKDDKIYINSYDNLCVDTNMDPSKTIICNLTQDIVTDKEGFIISSKLKNSTKTIIDEDNSFSNSFEYEFKNIPKENSEDFDEKTYKKNLDIIFSLTKSFMKKEVVIDNFTDFLVDVMAEEEEQNEEINLRELKEEIEEIPGVYEENIYTKTISNISMDLNLKNDIGLEGQPKAKSIHNVNNEEYNELSMNQIQTNLKEILNKFISIFKGANKLAKQLYEKLNEPLLNFMDIISQNIENINKILANKDLSEIFDSTLAINELDSLPFDFVTATNNLYNAMNNLKENLLYTIDNIRNKLKNDVSTFLANSHNLMFKLFENLSELSEALSTNENKIVGISSYYLNNTDTSYYEIIQEAKNILDNYYKNEKNLIYPLVNDMLENFEKNTINIIEKYQNMLDSISERLNDGNLIILLANNEDYQQAIKNIYNTKLNANEIIETVKNKFLESINLKSNGYFETQNEINENAQSYGQKSENAVTISYNLDKNNFIDKDFDKVMTSFRDKFLILLKNMENSIKDKFALEEDVLSTSSFQATYLSEIDEYFNTQKINILNLIKNENNEYLKSVNDIINSFKSENGKSLDQVMSDLLNAMTDLYLDNLNRAYSDSLDTSFKKINEIITHYSQLGNQYLSNVKNANSYHITTGFINKYNIFISSIQIVQDYINKNLKINLSNKYKNVITQIRSLLQSIKSNSILDKYYTQLPSAEKHLNSIKDLFEVFNRHITDENYNMKFLPLINNFIINSNNNIIKIKNDFKNIYDEMAKKDLNKIYSDYDKKRIEEKTSCSRSWRRFWRKKCTTTKITHYDPYNVKGTDNYLNVKDINFEEYMVEFDKKYNELYPGFSQNINSYNSLLSKLDSEIDKETKKDVFKEKNIYLDNISQKVNSIIEEKLGINLLTASYNYFKNKITNTLPNELNDIIEQWKNAYDETYSDLESNKNNFKSSIFEIYLIGSLYRQIYCQKIAYSYGDLIVNKLKNDFNYTNKYYYNIIISKINKTYSYILNNLPINEKPFDEILNMRINEIKTSYNTLLSTLKNSRNEILDKTKQELKLQVNSNNFFFINNIINEHIQSFTTSITEKENNLQSIALELYKENPEELVVAKFYLENSINGKQIKENYDAINKATFVDLQTDVYQRLIDDIWKIDRDELIKNIINTLTKFNETNNNSFKFEKEKYIEILQNKLYTEFYTKDGLITKINLYFSNGINSCDENFKTQIDDLLSSVLNKIKTHITNEASRLSEELTSYSNVFTDIKNRLNSYKNNIYQQFYSAITYIVEDFHEQIMEKFYKNFIEKGLNEFEQNIEKTNFGTANFLNMSINLNEVINKEFQLLITDYKNLTLNQIEFLYKKNIQTLEEFFSVSEMKLKIFSEIDNVYNTKLLPQLQNVGTHNPGDEGVSNYDLSKTILDDIDSFITDKITIAKNIIKKIEGKEYNINDIVPADFSSGKNNIYTKITKMFENFTISYTTKEKKEFDKVVGNNAINNFRNLMNNFIPSFGVDFFDRILKFNEIQKIQMLYYNLKHSLAETIPYYISLASISSEVHLPVDIKLSLYSLNNLDSVVVEKNNLILSTLNNKLDSYFEETKNYIVNKYINDMNTNEEFDLKFKTNLKDIIKGVISGNIHNYENDYINMMKEYIKDPFISDYTKVLNEATKDMKDYIENSKIELKAELDNVFNLDSDSVIANIQVKLNNTKLAVEKYIEHFGTFKISEEVINFLDTFGEKIMVPKYKQIKELLDKRTAELVIINLEKLSNEFRSEYSVEFFEQEINEMNKNISSYIDIFNNILKQYGSIEDIYTQNLDKEISNYTRIRLLDEASNSEPKIAEEKFDKIFINLKQSSTLVKDFIQSLNLFNIFEDNIQKYINEKSKEYSLTKYNLEKNKDKNENYDLMNERLDELNQLSSEYYSQTQSIYDNMKNQIINNIIGINDLIQTCEKVTSDIISNKYIAIKNNFNKIEENKNTEKKTINIPEYKFNQTDNYFTVETKVENYLVDNKFILDLIENEETKTYKVIGRVVNNIKPKIFDIDFYSTTGQNNKLGRKINVIFNNISSYTDIIFDSSLNKATITTNFNFEEYSIKTQYYETRFLPIQKIIMGMTIIIPGVPKTVDIDTPDSEKTQFVSSKNKTLIENFTY